MLSATYITCLSLSFTIQTGSIGCSAFCWRPVTLTNCFLFRIFNRKFISSNSVDWICLKLCDKFHVSCSFPSLDITLFFLLSEKRTRRLSWASQRNNGWLVELKFYLTPVSLNWSPWIAINFAEKHPHSSSNYRMSAASVEWDYKSSIECHKRNLKHKSYETHPSLLWCCSPYQFSILNLYECVAFTLNCAANHPNWVGFLSEIWRENWLSEADLSLAPLPVWVSKLSEWILFDLCGIISKFVSVVQAPVSDELNNRLHPVCGRNHENWPVCGPEYVRIVAHEKCGKHPYCGREEMHFAARVTLFIVQSKRKVHQVTVVMLFSSLHT